MKNKTYFTIGLLLLGLLVALLGCRPDKKDDPVNPCAGKTIPKGEIFVSDYMGEWEDFDLSRVSIADSFQGRILSFSTTIAYESYQWQIGNDPRIFTEKSLQMDFRGESEMKIRVRFIGRRKIDSLCFPKDDGLDTLQRDIYLVDKWPLYGTYRGADTSNPGVYREVRIYRDTVFKGETDKPLVIPLIVGLVNNWDEFETKPSRRWNSFNLTSSNFFWISSSEVIAPEYSKGYYNQRTGQLVIDYTGRKINEQGIGYDLPPNQFVGFKVKGE
jgi:hypothetical protein